MAVGPGTIRREGVYLDNVPTATSYIVTDFNLTYPMITMFVRCPKTIEKDGTVYKFDHFVFTGADAIGIGLVKNRCNQVSSAWDYRESAGTLYVSAYYTSGGGGGGRPNITITAAVTPDNSGLVQIDGAPASTTQTAIVTYGNPVSLDTAKIPYSVSGRDFRFLKWVSTDGNESHDPKFSYVPTRDAVWIAMYVEIYHEGLILYDKNSNPSMVLYDTENNKVMRDIKTGEMAIA